MRLILTIAGDAPPGCDRMRSVTSGTLSIGRDACNNWVLPDPGRILSKRHCTITEDGGRFVLTDLSRNGIVINEAAQPTSADSRVVLSDGDRLRLGPYLIMVTEVDDRPGLDSASDLPNMIPRQSDPFGSAPIGSPRGSDSPLNVDPFADPLGHDRRSDSPPLFQSGAKPRLHQEPEDPFEVPPGHQQRGLDPDADLFRGKPASPDWHGAPRPDHAPPYTHAMPHPRPAAASSAAVDFDKLLGDFVAGVQRSSSENVGFPSGWLGAGTRPVPDQVANQEPVTEPARKVPVEPTSPLPAPPAAAPPETDRSSNARTALAAFLEGAGLEPGKVNSNDPEAALRAAGQIFRELAEGVRELLISRAAIKGEMRITQTMIRARDNNALKFSVTPEEAVLALLSPGRPGYKDPLAAAKEAFHDIKSHELAVIAGVQTALLELLRRFDPNELEERLIRTRLDSVLPAARKARYWDAFRQTYNEISREAEDNFYSVFGRAFAEAYTAKTRE